MGSQKLDEDQATFLSLSLCPMKPQIPFLGWQEQKRKLFSIVFQVNNNAKPFHLCYLHDFMHCVAVI